jgi:hypothetical protein
MDLRVSGEKSMLMAYLRATELFGGVPKTVGTYEVYRQ